MATRSKIPSPSVTPDDYILALRRDGNRIAVAADGWFARIVPSCPRWTIADLLWHLGNVHTFWRQVAVGVVIGPGTYREPGRPNETLLRWFHDGLEETADTLGRMDPETPARTWGHRKNGAPTISASAG
ncbi:maleylpyruvate isomerase N-terminal domain-containing protein [Mycobacterium simiae]|uniref:maleylpyruvate isomerase N-terminal domain-containing protein n=1 Tax=Mycobacterium simiae TaxID=1784 RepID=UPI001CB6F4DF|nr:maleylpyruvate isomerase N-terminal domain-containing protein [Mycobacterium simiae]